MSQLNPAALAAMRKLSPRRHSTAAQDVDQLVAEQLAHFGIDPASPFGASLANITAHLYESQASVEDLWRITLDSIHTLDRTREYPRVPASDRLVAPRLEMQ